MHLVRLFKIACHLCEKLVGADPDIYGKAQAVPNLVLDLTCQGNGIRINQRGPRHVEKAFIHGKLLHDGRILSANCHKGPGISFIKAKARRNQNKSGTLLQCHGNRFSRGHAIFLRGDRFCQNDPRSFVWITANRRGNQAQILPTLGKPFGGFPGKICTVDVHVKNQSLHCFLPCLPLARYSFGEEPICLRKTRLK